MKDKIKVTPRRASGSVREIEFMVTGPGVKGGSQGGLISLVLLPDGSVLVEAYRCDPEVYGRKDRVPYRITPKAKRGGRA